jgi:hypothetical protein
VRLRVEGRSVAVGKPPAWLARVASFDIVGLREGSTVLAVEAHSLLEAAPERFSQVDLFPFVDATRSCLDFLEEGLRDAVEGRPDSDAYDDGLIKTFEEFSRILRHEIDVVELTGGIPLRVDAPGIETFRRLRIATIRGTRAVRNAQWLGHIPQKLRSYRSVGCPHLSG